MLTQFVNRIEQHPESVFVQADILARMKRDTMADVTGWFQAIRALWRKFQAHQPATSRNDRLQRGRVEQDWRQETL